MQAYWRRVGTRLRWARELVFKTQTEFALALDLDRSTVAKIENGERALSGLTLVYAASKLRCGADYLLFGELLGVDQELRDKLLELHPELYLSSEPIPPRPRKPIGDPLFSKPQRRYRLDIDRAEDTEDSAGLLRSDL